MKIYNVIVVDDHVLLAQGIAGLVNSFGEFNVVKVFENGQQLIDDLEKNRIKVDIVLMDVKMPILNGIETTKILKEKYPDMKVLALSVEDEENTIIKMLKAGAKGYLLKDVDKEILYRGLIELINNGFYHTKEVSSILMNSSSKTSDKIELKDREIEFLKYVCKEMTYKEIAASMFLSPKTIDGYRDVLFEKLQTKNRIGLVIYAIKHKIVEV